MVTRNFRIEHHRQEFVDQYVVSFKGAWIGTTDTYSEAVSLAFEFYNAQTRLKGNHGILNQR